MNDTILTQEGPAFGGTRAARAFLVVHVDGGDTPSRVVELPDGTDVTFGRSRNATMTVDHEKVSRMHARVRRTGDAIEIEDLQSRNGTRVNGEKITGLTRLENGDEIGIGPIQAIVGMTSGLRRASAIAEAEAGEARLAAEVDRSVRYRRPMTVAVLHCIHDGIVETLARNLRPMDLVAEDAGDDYLVILPELTRAEGAAALDRLVYLAATADVEVKAGAAQCPDDGTTAEALIGAAREGLRSGRSPSAVPSLLTRSDEEPLVIDAAMKKVYSLVDRFADTNTAVLIVGETGVGKELVVEALHRRSARRDRLLAKVNCASMTEPTLEAELFGTERGAGQEPRRGAFEMATDGTVFLDEIGELPLGLQAKLLRVLERGSFTRVGGAVEIATGARLVAATHRDLEAAVRAETFRQDFLYRIGGFTVVVPPLRDRNSEIIPLAEHFAKTAATQMGKPIPPPLSEEACDALFGYAWPGNVRELRNAIERALVLCGDQITVVDLPDKLRHAAQRLRPVAPSSTMRGHLEDIERAAIVQALDGEGGNQTRAARKLGLSRRALIYKMEKYGLKPPPGSAA